MATQQAMRTERIARELGVRLDAMELQVGAKVDIRIIRRQGPGNVRHLDLSYLRLPAAVRRKQVTLEKVQSGHNMANPRTQAPERETIDRHMENLSCV